MDDEMPLKRADLRKRAEKKAAELAAEGMDPAMSWQKSLQS